MFDLDGLKSANDTLGHAAGDAILREAAGVLRSTLRVHDGCYRLGGDEFAALLPETDHDAACQAARRCINAIANAQLGRGRVGLSAGLAELRPDETSAAFVGRADAALYEHKRKKRAARSANAKATSRIRRAR
jgi:diguanylate cyclase (GGDEF)-like protein